MRPLLNVIGAGLVLLDGVVCHKNTDTPLQMGSMVTLAAQTDMGELLSLVVMAVYFNPVAREHHVVSSVVADASFNATTDVASVAPHPGEVNEIHELAIEDETEPHNVAPTDTWLLECISAEGLPTSAFESLPRVFGFCP